MVHYHRLLHYRSPDIPGGTWQRTAPLEALENLPAAWAEAFPLMELETYKLGKELAEEDNG